MIDASALVSIISGEVDAADLRQSIMAAPERITTPLAVFETALSLVRKSRERGLSLDPTMAMSMVETFLDDQRITIRPIDTAQMRLAAEAADRYGKGRHTAALNLGDCFAWAAARRFGTRLIYKGAHFAQTDLA